MPKIIDTIRFMECGKPAPKNSRFQGVMTADTIFGTKGYLDYTGRTDATEEKITDKLICDENGFLDYTSRDEAAEGVTVSSMGILTKEKRKEFRKLGSAAFSKPGDLMWDMVISLESFEEAEKNSLYHQADYAAVIQKILPQFFKKVGFDPNNMIWWMDYHNNKQHPHMHICFLEKNHTRNKGAFTEKQLRSLKQIIAKEMTVRQTVKELTGNTYDKQFQLLDEGKKEVLNAINNIDFNRIQSVADLAEILPKTGRIQYGSTAMIPYRETIDRITDSLLSEEPIKGLYESYMSALKPLNTAMMIDAQSSSIQETELKKLYVQIGNIILKDLKQFNAHTKGVILSKESLIQYMDRKEKGEGYSGSREVLGRYLEIRRKHEEAENNRFYDDLKQVYTDYSSLLDTGCENRMRAALNHRLAQMEFYGEGVERNLNLAKMHCMKAMMEGSKHSFVLMYKICFAKGNTTDGVNALYAGALNGDALSEYLLGKILLQGKHWNRDRTGGMMYIRMAALQGFEPAQDYLERHDKSGYALTLHDYVKNSIFRYLSGSSIVNELSGYLHNDDQIHHHNSSVESEVDAYLNNQKTQARRGR